jgi:hypothetical protein
MSTDDVALILEQLEDLVREQSQGRIAEALEDIASILYDIKEKL